MLKEIWLPLGIILAVITALIVGTYFLFVQPEINHCHDLGCIMTKVGCIKSDAIING